MSYTNFQVGEKFPLPIKSQGDGGIFQYDINGAMFILKLSTADLVNDFILLVNLVRN